AAAAVELHDPQPEAAGRAAVAARHGHVEAAAGEEALLLAEVDRRHIDDRDDSDLDVRGAFALWLVLGRTPAGRREQQRGGRGEGDEGPSHGTSWMVAGVTGRQVYASRTGVLVWNVGVALRHVNGTRMNRTRTG